jgi:hypothetical protein
LEFYEEPPVLRFFSGLMRPKCGWAAELPQAFEGLRTGLLTARVRKKGLYLELSTGKG